MTRIELIERLTSLDRLVCDLQVSGSGQSRQAELNKANKVVQTLIEDIELDGVLDVQQPGA